MKLMLRASILTGMFHEHPASAYYWKPIERPYPGVPRKGDVVTFDDGNARAVEVASVEWDARGEVVVDLGDGWDLDELVSAGFTDTRSSSPWIDAG